jgi:hypothetical protein
MAWPKQQGENFFMQDKPQFEEAVDPMNGYQGDAILEA